MNPNEEQRLTQQLRAGSPRAWQTLYDAHAERIWQVVARRAGSRAADVADIVQETFLAAARAARGFDTTRGSLALWLCGIARHQAALYYRRRQTRPSAGEIDHQAGFQRQCFEWLAGSEREPAEVLASVELGAAVRAALAKLSVEHETLLVAKYLEELSLEQIAQSEGLSLAAVSSKLARARRAFREAFAPEAAEVKSV